MTNDRTYSMRLYSIFMQTLLSFRAVDAVICHPDPSSGLLAAVSLTRALPSAGASPQGQPHRGLAGDENRRSSSSRPAVTLKVIPAQGSVGRLRSPTSPGVPFPSSAFSLPSQVLIPEHPSKHPHTYPRSKPTPRELGASALIFITSDMTSNLQ